MIFRPLATLLCSACFIATSLPVSTAQAAMAEPAVMVSQQATEVLLNAVQAVVAQNPALADGSGKQALLMGVKRAVSQQPELADGIIASARQIRPGLGYEIEQAAQAAVGGAIPQPVVEAPVAPVQTTPVRPIASTGGAAASTGGSLGTSTMIGLAGVAGVVGAALAIDEAVSDEDDATAHEAFLTEEFENQGGLNDIKASFAYARGGTGAGVTVAVLDSGLETSHPDIDGNFSPNGFNFVEGNPVVTDVDAEGHGTHVSGIIAAERDGASGDANMHGVAYDSTILPIRIIGALGGVGDAVTTSTEIIAGTDYAVAQGAQIINGSFGPDYSERTLTNQVIEAADVNTAAAYQNAADAGVILVFAAGNDYDENPPVAANPTGGGIYPYVKPANADTGVYDDSGANRDFSDLEGMLLAVVATDTSGEIATFSNRCGVAADWCLAAPGVSILSMDEDLTEGPAYVEMSGTSMAAPQVSGALAVLIDLFPELTPEEIVERLLIAANKTGIYANSVVYGQGFLDLEKATRPIGSLSVSTSTSVSGARFSLDESGMSLGPAFGDGLRAALVGHKLAVFDQQNATFMVDLGDFARTANSRLNLDEALRRFRSRFGEKTIQMGADASLSYTMVDLGKHGSIRHDPSLDDRGAYMEMNYQQQIAGAKWQMNYNINPSTMYGIYQSKLADQNAMLSRDAFAAPYLSFAKQGYSMGSEFDMRHGFSLRVGTFHGYPQADELRPSEERAESFGHMMELAYQAGAIRLFSQVGMLTEKETFLGSRTEGAFDLKSGTHTNFAGVNGAYELSPNWSLVGSYYRGISSPKIDSRSLFNDISDVQTESFSLGMLGSDVLRAGDSLGLLGNQPLRVEGGEASLSLATGRSRSGLLYKQDYEINLSPTGRELNLEAFYHMNLPESGTQLMSTMMYRTEPGHIENAPDEGIILFQLQQPF